MSAVLRGEAEARLPLFLAGGRKDELAWAKRFKCRYEHHDPDVKKYQYDMAIQALKNNEETL
jgi:hypothetical protein